MNQKTLLALSFGKVFKVMIEVISLVADYKGTEIQLVRGLVVFWYSTVRDADRSVSFQWM